MADNINWLQYLANPHSFTLKRYLFEVLGNRYQKNETFIERLSSVLNTQDDVEKLGALIRDLYEAGFIRAVERYRGELEKMGYSTTVTQEEPKKKDEKIFPDQSEKSG
jgi:hypothetical protein